MASSKEHPAILIDFRLVATTRCLRGAHGNSSFALAHRGRAESANHLALLLLAALWLGAITHLTTTNILPRRYPIPRFLLCAVFCEVFAFCQSLLHFTTFACSQKPHSLHDHFKEKHRASKV